MRYNSSGATHIGLADMVDALNVIESAVFSQNHVSFQDLITAVANDFSGEEEEKLRLYLKNRTPKYGTEQPIARKNARNLVGHLYQTYQSYTNYRGGEYRPAYWTMTNLPVWAASAAPCPTASRPANSSPAASHRYPEQRRS